MKSPLGWILLGAAAVILLKFLLWPLLAFLLHLAFGLAYVAAIVVMVLFVIALIRRMILAR